MKLTSVVEPWNVNTGKNTPVTMSLLTIPPTVQSGELYCKQGHYGR
ncbi:MAG: hypothetical protein LUQ56_02740 [Methylococcaceae bacterium]|nr:hypothetical protein [Methylococcaceae bacterium]MDD1637038.1 hypothetical protein [Methylococcaceae bacterium]